MVYDKVIWLIRISGEWHGNGHYSQTEWEEFSKMSLVRDIHFKKNRTCTYMYKIIIPEGPVMLVWIL